MKEHYFKKLIGLIVIATICRLFLAANLQLGNDEVYYRMYAEVLQINYFDHPPMVGWLIRLFTLNLNFDTELFIRLTAIIGAAITTWLIFKIGLLLQNARTGFLAALFYTITLYGAIISGTFILPDGPQIVCWASALLLLVEMCTTVKNAKQMRKAWLYFGLWVGLAMLCKVHSIFLLVPAFTLCVISPNQFKWIHFLLAFCIVLIFFSPILIWNWQHQFVTYNFHSNRVNLTHAGFSMEYFLPFLLGQIGYYHPILFCLIVVAVFKSIHNYSVKLVQPKQFVLVLSAVPLIAIATLLSLFREVLPHWTGPASIAVALLLAQYCDWQLCKNASNLFLKRIINTAVIFTAVLIVTAFCIIKFYPGTMGKKDVDKWGDGDATLDMYGWSTIKFNLQTWLQNDALQHPEMKSAPIITYNWFTAAHLDYYVATPLRRPLFAWGPLQDIHQYQWLNDRYQPIQTNQSAYCILTSENYRSPFDLYGKYFNRIERVFSFDQLRNGKCCRKIYVYRLLQYRGNKAEKWE